MPEHYDRGFITIPLAPGAEGGQGGQGTPAFGIESDRGVQFSWILVQLSHSGYYVSSSPEYRGFESTPLCIIIGIF
jgi:hypothetical protein